MFEIDQTQLDLLLDKAKQGDIDARERIYSQFMPMVHRTAQSFFLLGGDKDDLIQEGMIGLFDAINDYDSGKGNFYAFCQMCVRRKILSAVSSGNANKNRILMDSVSIDDKGLDLTDDSGNPLEVVMGQDLLKELNAFIETNLSDTEKQALKYYVKGYSYGEIATLTGKPYKAVDTALQRAKKKLGAFKE